MGIFLKKEHMLADVHIKRTHFYMYISQHMFFFEKNTVFTTCSHSLLYILVLNIHALTPCIMTPSYFLTKYTITTITNQPPPLHRLPYPLQTTTHSLLFVGKRRQGGVCGRKRTVLSCVSPCWPQVRACVLSVVLAVPMHSQRG